MRCLSSSSSSSLFLSLFPFLTILSFYRREKKIMQDNKKGMARQTCSFLFYLSFEKGDAKGEERGNGRGPLSPSLSIWVSLVFSLSLRFLSIAYFGL